MDRYLSYLILITCNAITYTVLVKTIFKVTKVFKIDIKDRFLMNIVTLDNWKFNAYESILLAKVSFQILNTLEKCLSPICCIVKKRYAMKDMST